MNAKREPVSLLLLVLPPHNVHYILPHARIPAHQCIWKEHISPL